MSDGDSEGVQCLSFGETAKALFNGECFTIDGVRLSYCDIRSIEWCDVANVLNGIPLEEKLILKLELSSGRKIKLREKIDIRPAISKVPIAKIFKSEMVKDKKKELHRKREISRENFFCVLKHLEKMSGVGGIQFKSVW